MSNQNENNFLFSVRKVPLKRTVEDITLLHIDPKIHILFLITEILLLYWNCNIIKEIEFYVINKIIKKKQ